VLANVLQCPNSELPTGIRVARLRDITLHLKARLELLERRRLDEEERHKDALRAIDRQLRHERERHKDTLEGIERDREVVRDALDLEQQFLTETPVNDLERQLLTETHLPRIQVSTRDVRDDVGVGLNSVAKRASLVLIDVSVLSSRRK
jgi:hypothetical protein